ncbi:MAG TPA: alpha-glucuronidase [Rikenellaceae bacterium]|nr:alpha-glucuronidase [Rikenellaceae bacterium]
MKRLLLTISLFACINIHADDGSRLWLEPATTGTEAKIVVDSKQTATTDIAKEELSTGWHGGEVHLKVRKLKEMKPDAFAITRRGSITTITSPSDIGLLYGAYRLIQLQRTAELPEEFEYTDSPFHDFRILNHWDNLDGNSERGYAGKSIFWNVHGHPDTIGTNDTKEIVNCPLNNNTYARACASVGINGAVLNNVNASPMMLSSEVLKMAKQYADNLRPYGIRIYLSVNFSSPIIVGGLPTADPMNKEVQNWWKAKAKEIYSLIPDFGGFLVKANSEGQPGPMDYGRTHADGANLLARAIRPYGGIVMWRAFINNPTDPDRAKQARLEFEDLDGQFLDNVIIQVKNGPVDFQPREPFNALFGALKKTAEMAEFQITQEYLGQANHLAYLGTMWEEFFDEVTQFADYIPAQQRARYNAIAGVANTGTDPDWTGHPLAQSNWYAFGRLAWNPELDAKTIAQEWTKLTFPSLNDSQRETLISMLMRSREAVVDYEMPIGLHHQFGDSHYAPGVWDKRPIRRDWLPTFYNQADSSGIGFDRTAATGSGNTSQYDQAFGGIMENLSTCPDKYLLWFHHVPWTHICQSGRTVWEELCYRYQHGIDEVRDMQRQWNSLEGAIDPEIFRDVQVRLMTQARDAQWWKDGSVLYFQSLHRLPLPDFLEPPVHTLEECKNSNLNVGLYRSPTHEELNRVR